MSKRNVGERIKLTSYEELLGITENAANQMSDGTIMDIPLDDLHAFKNHPFRIVNDEKMEELADSIRENGVLVPGIVRSRAEGGYELISGHRRKFASQLAGKKTMSVIIKECSDDEAVEIMVDSNIQREDILPSEKAKAYRMKYEAMKHHGRAGGRSLNIMSDEVGDAPKTIQRFIRISHLSQGLLDLLDEKKLGLGQGVELSYLAEEAQDWVYEVLQSTKCSISAVQATMIKEKYRAGSLDQSAVIKILQVTKAHPRKITFHANKLDHYFEPDMSNEEIEELILTLLDEWKEGKRGA